MKRILYSILLLSLGLCLGCTSAPKEIGIQLYSLRNEISTQGIAHTLDKVADIGYTNIELAGYADGLIYGMPPADFKQMAEDKGLKIVSSHVVRFLSDRPQEDIAYWTQAIKLHAKMGVHYLVMSTLPWWEKENYSMEDVATVCDYFNQIGAIAKSYGIAFGFHNHDHAFEIMVGGKTLYSRLLDGLDPDKVFMQMDVYWVNRAGHKPVHYLKSYAGRYPVLHIKDDDVIGASGKIDFEAVFDAAYAQGMLTFFVEIENYRYSPLEDAKRSFDFLNEASFVK